MWGIMESEICSSADCPPEQPPLRGCLVVFEGIDGTGKSTQVQLLAQYLRERGYEVVTDYEPTRGPWGMKVREAALAGDRLGIDEEIDCLLQDRREHVRDVIEPALARGAWVLLDRYYLSMMAYQGASGVSVEDLREWNEAFATVPDIAFWLDISLETAVERMRVRGNGADAFEHEPFLQACMNIYSAMEMPWLHRVEADAGIDEVHRRVLDLLHEELGI